jgi:hypothetical protein
MGNRPRWRAVQFLMTRARRRNSALLLVQALVFAAATGGSVVAEPRQSTGPSQPPSAETPPLPGGIQLQPGYRHRPKKGFDTTIGVIWKDGGPTVRYEIGLTATPHAQEYRQTHKSIWRTTSKVKDMSLDFVLDADQDILVATIGNYANFTATGVKSRRDASEVMLTIASYDIRRGRGGQTAPDANVSLMDVLKPSPFQLQPGYQRRPIPTIDGNAKGVMWKEGGPRIDYEIDFNGLSPRGVPGQRGGTIWKATITLARGIPQDLVFDDDADSVVMTIGRFVNFTATGVMSRRDLAEVLLMLMTYNGGTPP